MENADLESSIISACLLDFHNFETLRQTGVSESSFTNHLCRRLFSIFRAYDGRPFDAAVILAEHPDLPAEKVLSLSMAAASTVYLREWCAAIRTKEARRSIELDLDAARKDLQSGGDVAEIVRRLTGSIEGAAAAIAVRPQRTLSELTLEAFHDVTDVDTGVPWFEPDTEARRKIIHRPGRIFIIAAEPGCGKTEFSLGCVVKPAIDEGKRVLYVCSESPASEIFGRLASMYSRTPYPWLLRTKEDRYLQPWLAKMKELSAGYADRLFVRGTESGIRTPSAVRHEIKMIEAEFGRVDLVVIDYLQNFFSDYLKANSDYFVRITDVMENLKKVVDEFGCACLINSQLSRTDSRKSERPSLYRLKGSGEIEANAHCVCFLWIDPAKKEDSVDPVYRLYSVKTRCMEPFDIGLRFGPGGYYPVVDHKYSEEDAQL